jgi:hypothetical protein
MDTQRSNQKIEGIIIPSNWDENGLIKGVSIYTSDEKEYLVQLNSLSRELLDHVHHKVEVTGKILEHLNGRRQIILNSYRKITEPSEVT